MKKILIAAASLGLCFSQTAEVYKLLPSESATGQRLWDAMVNANTAYNNWAEGIALKHLDQRNCSINPVCNPADFAPKFEYAIPAKHYIWDSGSGIISPKPSSTIGVWLTPGGVAGSTDRPECNRIPVGDEMVVQGPDGCFPTEAYRPTSGSPMVFCQPAPASNRPECNMFGTVGDMPALPPSSCYATGTDRPAPTMPLFKPCTYDINNKCIH